MKILFVVDTLDDGGAGRVVSRLSNEMIKNNDISILTLKSKNVKYNINDKINHYHIDDFFKKKYKTKIASIKNVMLLDCSDIVLSFLSKINLYCILACKSLKKKIIVSERNDPRKKPNSFFKRIIRNLLYKKADGWVFQTENAKNYFSSKIKNNGVIILNPLENKIPYRENVDKNKIVCVGRLVKQKNYKMAIDSFKLVKEKMPGVKLYIYGDGPEKENISLYISQNMLNDSVILMGNVDNIYDKIKDSNLFIMTSLYEGLPNALMEALAIGIPCVSTNESNGGAKRLISNGENGYLVEIGDTSDFSNKMIDALTIDNEKFSNNGIKIREYTDVESVAINWMDYIKKVLNKV